MAVIKSGILGGGSGKVASVVMTSWKGIDVLKGMPNNVANPRTAAQVAQRDKFSGVVKLGKTLLVETIKPLWDRFAQRESGFNAFISANIGNFTSIGEISAFDSVVIGKGNLTAIPSFTVSPVEDTDTSIVLSWVDNSGSGTAQGTDVAYIVVLRVNDGAVIAQDSSAMRSDAGATVAIPAQAATTQLYAYLVFRKVDGTRVSNTVYTEFAILP
jgi:hypothetical protein